jgi:LmbE family N-acetylglucosaminyl deacetylase
MKEKLKLLAILAHPDDESLGLGGTLAKYATEGAETYLITATRGEKGWSGAPKEYPGPEAFGQIREQELYGAARVLGLKDVILLDYVDGELDQASPHEIIGQLVTHIRRIKPQVVVTFDPNGLYGHPDHIAISQFTSAAVLASADLHYPSPLSHQIHRVDKLYYLVMEAGEAEAYQEAFGDLVMYIHGVERRPVAWQNWAITTRIDTTEYCSQVWKAISSHCSQLPGYQALKNLSEENHRNLWGTQRFYRALSVVNGGREQENDLFEGILNEDGYEGAFRKQPQNARAGLRVAAQKRKLT